MAKQALIWAGAALQIILFQLLVWAMLAGDRTQAMALGAAAVAVAAGTYMAYSTVGGTK